MKKDETVASEVDVLNSQLADPAGAQAYLKRQAKKDDLVELIFLYAITGVCAVVVGLLDIFRSTGIPTLGFWLFIALIFAIISFRTLNLLRKRTGKQ